MNHHVKRGLSALSFFGAAVALGTAACSQGPSPSHDGEGTFDDTTGALVAHLKRIPDDVRCIEIQTSDWRRSQVQIDVEPGTEATIRIAPLQPNFISFSGVAYGVRCWDIWGGDGGAYANQTWVADSAYTTIHSGRATPVTLTFRKLGSADVSVDFADPTACDAGPGWGADAASCPPPPWADAGVYP